MAVADIEYGWRDLLAQGFQEDGSPHEDFELLFYGHLNL